MSRRTLLAISCVLIGFLAVAVVRSRPADPETRLPRRFALVGLIRREQRDTEALRARADELRRRLEAVRQDAAGRRAGSEGLEARLDEARLAAGLVALEGPGVRVVLDDSELQEAPTGNVNDLVIHSQDVQAVVNALWRSGGEAIAINGQRLVGTSAVLCVGNTLLLNGTVHSPPYEVVALGADRSRFDGDRLVRRLRADADAFGLRFSVDALDEATVPAFDGAVTFDTAASAPGR